VAVSPYVYERQGEYWTSKLIEDYLLDFGFEIIALPIPANIEYSLPADFIFFDKLLTKLFGLQYKALYHNKRDHWQLDEHQHRTLELYPWIYYCLLELREAKEFRAALHLARLAKPSFSYRSELYPVGPERFSDYSRWATFYRELEHCRRGVLVSSDDHLKQLLIAGSDDPSLSRISREATDIFLLDFASRHAMHYSPFLGRTT
jgi:hypothetical protein